MTKASKVSAAKSRVRKFGSALMKKKQKEYADYSEDEHVRINNALMMCSEINDSNPDHIGGVFKFAIIQGHIRWEDAKALAESDPYLTNIMVGGCNTNLKDWIRAQKSDKPFSLRTCLDGVLHYYDLIVSDYLKFRDEMGELHTKKPLAYAVGNTAAQEPFTHIFGDVKNG